MPLIVAHSITATISAADTSTPASTTAGNGDPPADPSNTSTTKRTSSVSVAIMSGRYTSRFIKDPRAEARQQEPERQASLGEQADHAQHESVSVSAQTGAIKAIQESPTFQGTDALGDESGRYGIVMSGVGGPVRFGGSPAT